MAGPKAHTQYSLVTESMSWLGIDLLEGLSDGDNSIHDEPNDANGWSQKPSGVGTAVQSFNPGTSGVLTLMIDQEHPLTQTLNAMVELDRALQNIVGPIVCKRGNGKLELYHNARITKHPPEQRGVAAGSAEWKWIYTSKTTRAATTPANIIVPAT
jgi:hypothetical protein